MKAKELVIRVYGIYIDPEKGLLVSDELIKGRNITKLPGGGLELGEGTVDCLKREMMEETGSMVEIVKHFYTTDFFVESFFDTSKQVISIYYRMEIKTPLAVSIKKTPYDFDSKSEGAQAFRFIPLKEIEPDQFTLVIDRHVAALLREHL